MSGVEFHEEWFGSASQEALAKLSDALGALPAGSNGEAIQNASLNVARASYQNADAWGDAPWGID